VQEGIVSRRGEHSVLAMGGVGEMPDTDHLIQEISLRGFWKHYHKLMKFPEAGRQQNDNGEAQ
jgi:anthranilate 1,2-dioxygenase large subunit